MTPDRATRRGRGTAAAWAAVGLVVPLVLSACSYLTGTRSPPRPDERCCGGATDELRAVYLGTGGWILEWDGEMVLGAPLFSNPDIWTVGVGSIRSDTVAADTLLPHVSDARAILVGHAHYDHLLDVPWIARRRAPASWILGNRSMAHLLAGDPALDPDRIHVLNERAAGPDGGGSWVALPGGRVRVFPIRTEHSPHAQGVELFTGTVAAPLSTLPTRARDWRGGLGLAYLIDFLDRAGEVAYRVYYSDISASAPWGLPPRGLLDRGPPVDLAILCAPSYHEADWFPEALLLELRPRHTLLGHWEDFFAPWSRTPKSVQLTDLPVLTSRVARTLGAAGWDIPRPGDTLYVPSRAADANP